LYRTSFLEIKILYKCSSSSDEAPKPASYTPDISVMIWTLQSSLLCASQEKLTVIAGTVSPSAYRPSQQDHDKIAGYRMYQKRDRASRKWTRHSGIYTGGLTDSVLFPLYSRLINRLPGPHPVFWPHHTAASRFLPAPYNRFATPGPMPTCHLSNHIAVKNVIKNTIKKYFHKYKHIKK